MGYQTKRNTVAIGTTTASCTHSRFYYPAPEERQLGSNLIPVHAVGQTVAEQRFKAKAEEDSSDDDRNSGEAD